MAYVLVDFWEVVDRALTGSRMSERDWDFQVFHKTQEIVKEYGIEFDGETFVPSDDTLADTVFEAGLNLLTDIGGYCLGTNRVIEFSESEIKEALKAAPSELTIGSGKDARNMIHRDIEDKRRPNMFGRGMAPFEEGELYVRFAEAVAEMSFVDGFLCPNLLGIEGRRIRTLAHEVHASKYEVYWAKEGARRAGRPGLFVGYYPISTNPATMIASLDHKLGVTETDGILITPLPELKIEAGLLGVVAAVLDHGCAVLSQPSATLGGFAGGPEGAAVVLTANSLYSTLVYQTKIHCGPMVVAMEESIRNDPMCLWVVTVALQALNRNAHLIAGGVMGSLIGNVGTEMSLYEAMHRSLALVPCGSMILGTRPYKPLRLNMGTPLEVKWAYECGVAAVKYTREEADELSREVYKKYSGEVKHPPPGKTLGECYNLETMKPKPEYLALYERVKEDLRDLGIEI